VTSNFVDLFVLLKQKLPNQRIYIYAHNKKRNCLTKQEEEQNMRIGENGKTLKEMLEEKDRLLEETGCLWGLKELELHQEDPVKMMRFQSRVVGACITSRELAKLVSAAPTVRTVGECCFALLLPEGDAVAASLGLAGHVYCMPLQVRNMIQLGYEENPGIKSGDIFATNDPIYGAPHAADNYTHIPIFYNGEL
jgi:acetone carboxylase alpha subunit